MLEFTGERVVPGLVDPSLLHEHRARYRFAAFLAKRFGPEAAILDAGCGTGYGIAEFVGAGWVTAFDISAGAIGHARDHFSGARVSLLQAACELLPFADSSFDLIVAFEVIEHLEHWREMLVEAKRVLKPAGILLVSTPNKTYYAESRAEAGPNPFHVREFDLSEFAPALEGVFPHVTLWTQNHIEGLSFIPVRGPSAPGVLDAPEDHEPEHAYFFFAACSRQPFDCAESFAYIPRSGNVLRDRERHVSLLQSELEKKNAWLAQMEAEHLSLNRAHQELLAELQEHNAWAVRLNEDLTQSGTRIVELQDEIGAANRRFQEHVAALDGQAAERLIWIRDLETQILTGREEIERLNRENAWVRVKFEERTEWGESKAREVLRLTDEWHNLTAEIARLRAIVAEVDESKWMRLGRAVRLAPEVPGSGR